MPACVVDGCSPATRRADQGVILHVFPKERDQIRTWLMATGQTFNTLEDFVNKILASKPSDPYRMCSMHFAPNCYRYNPNNEKKRLTENAVPTIFTGVLPPAKRKRREAAPALPISLQPGDCCPTCSQVIPTRPEASEADALGTRVDKATTFDRTHGTRNKSVQASVRMFSVKTQCTRLRLRGTHPLPGAVPLSTDYVLARHWTQKRTNPTNNPIIQIESEPTDNPTAHTKSEPTDNPTTHTKSEPTDNPTTHTKSEPTDNPTTHTKSEPTDNPTAHRKSEPTDNPTAHTKSELTDNPTAHTKSELTDNPTAHTKSEPKDNLTVQIKSEARDDPGLQAYSALTDSPTVHIKMEPTAEPLLQTYSQPTDNPTPDRCTTHR
ncbi:hypothetical protein PRIEUP_LOCUS1955 [Pristimantis euphronides]